MTTIPRVEFLRVQIAEAKNRSFDKQREAGKQFIERFKEHLDELIADPYQFTSHTCYSEKIEGDMYANGTDSKFFIDYVTTQLASYGYRVEKSHDGGGMYETIVVRWDIVKSKRNFGDVGPPYDHIYAPGTR
jgi:hypothetical protein